MARSGGYVCAEYLEYDGCLVGFIPGNSEIKLLEWKWGTNPDRTAVLKTLRVSKHRFLDRLGSIRLLIGRPQRGTIFRWRQAGNKVRNLVEGNNTCPSLDDLLPNEQEALCSEFLRLDVSQQQGLPKLKHLMTSVGRTMKDVDILGIDDKGKPLLAQVTYGSRNSVQWKIDRLKKFKTNNKSPSLILFCRCDQKSIEDGIILFPIQEVFNIMSKTDYVRLMSSSVWGSF